MSLNGANQRQDAHRIEAEITCNRPRRVRPKSRIRQFAASLPLLLVVPFGVLFGVRPLLAIAVLLLGQNGAARIDNLQVTQGKKPTHIVSYSYRVREQNFAAQTNVDSDTFWKLNRGQKIAIRTLPELPFSESQVIFRGQNIERNAMSELAKLLICLCITTGFGWHFYSETFRQKQLLGNGLPTVGVIQSKEWVGGRSPHWNVRYKYAPIEYSNARVANHFAAIPTTCIPHDPLSATMSVARNQNRDEIGVGDEITVFFDARRPQRSLIYQFANYEVVL